MRKFPIAAFAAAALFVSGVPGAHAKSAVQCKPAITGYGQHIEKPKAQRMARFDFRAKAEAAYGKIVSDIVIGQGCTFLGAGKGWKCSLTSQPCVAGGLKPSIQKMQLVKPPRLGGRPGTRGGVKTLRLAPKLRAKRMQRLR